MSRLRKDPIVGRWIIISTERPKKPEDYSFEEQLDDVTPAECPFCSGNETKTPPEIASFRAEKSLPNTTGWWVRVIPSKFPVLHIEGTLEREGSGIYDWMNGIGAHEIIVESPEHALRLEPGEGAQRRLAPGRALQAGARAMLDARFAAREACSERGGAELVERRHFCPRAGGCQMYGGGPGTRSTHSMRSAASRPR